MDLLSLQGRKVRAVRTPDCPVCGPRATPRTWTPELPVEMDLETFEADTSNYALIDIRETSEITTALPGTALAIPASAFPLEVGAIDLPVPWLLCCTRGVRSKYLAMALRKAGHEEVYSLVGGAKALLQRERVHEHHG